MYSVPLSCVWQSPVQTQAHLRLSAAFFVPFPQHRWRNWDSEDRGHVQAPETPAGSHQTQPGPVPMPICSAQHRTRVLLQGFTTLPPGLSCSWV